MSQLKLSKSSLQKQREQMTLYRRLLPSLDLKRRQLTVELSKARKELERFRREVDELDRSIGEELPMMADDEIDLAGLEFLVGGHDDEFAAQASDAHRTDGTAPGNVADLQRRPGAP